MFPSQSPPFTMFLPSECSCLQNVLFLPSECSSLQKSPPFRMLLPSEWSAFQNFPFFRTSSIRMFLPWKCSSLQNVPPLKAFLPSECSSLESVPPLRMFFPWKRSSSQNVPPLKAFLPQNIPHLKAFLPSECSSLESVPPLRMFLPWKRSSPQNVHVIRISPPMFPCWKFISGIRRASVWLCALPCIYLGTDTCFRYEGKVRIVHSAQRGRITGAKFLVSWLGDKADSGKGMSYRPARQNKLAGRYDNSMSESTISPSQGQWI